MPGRSGGGRRRTNSSAGGSAAKKPRNEPQAVRPFALVYFLELVEKAGLVLGEDGADHVLRCEPFKFVEQLRSTLENNVDFPRNAAELVNGLETSCEDEDRLVSYLTKNIIVTPEDGEESRVIQSTVFRILLSVTCLQEYIVELVVKLATQYAIDEKPDKVQLMLKPFVLLENLVAESALAKGLVQILDVAGHDARLEVIVCLPNVVTQSEQQNVAPELCRIMTEDYELTPAILDCLTYFCLPSDLKTQVRDRTLNMLRTSAPTHFFPNLVTFLLIGCASEHSSDVIHGLRDGLDWTSVGGGAEIDKGTGQITTVLSLKNALRRSKLLASDWMKVINAAKEPIEHRPLDVIITLVLYSLKNGKEKTVENFYKKKIKSCLFTTSLVKSCVKNFKSVMSEYLETITELSLSLAKSKTEPSVRDFGIYWITALFLELENSRRSIIDELMCHESIEEKDFLTVVVRILSDIVKEDFELLKPYSLQLLSLVSKIDVLDTNNILQAMNVLCGLAFSVENSLLQDDVHMLIRKQVSNSDTVIKNRGIASGIMAIKHMVCLNSDSSTCEEQDSENIELPDGAPKEAAVIVELILKSTLRYPELICYFYDEFSKMLQETKHTHPIFLKWLINITTEIFQNNFVTDVNDNILRSVGNIHLSVQFCLDDAKDIEEPISVNIANVALGQRVETADLRTLPSLFRLLQLLYKNGMSGDLSSVDALLGCGIVMPIVDDDESLEEFNQECIGKILFCLVHCINWFRELIGAFCSQKDNEMRRKVIARLNELLILERKLAVYVSNTKVDDIKFPISTFSEMYDKNKYSNVRESKPKAKSKGGRGSKKKNAPKMNSSLPPEGTQKTQEDQPVAGPSAGTITKPLLNGIQFRNIQFDVVELFRYDFTIENVDTSMTENAALKLNTDSLLFLTNEMNTILSAIFLSSDTKPTHHLSKAPKQTVSTISATDAIDKVIAVLPRLCLFMEQMAEHIQKTIDSNDGIIDAQGLFTEENAKIQMCLGNIFKTLTTVFSWYGLGLPENKQRAVACYKVLADQCPEEEKQNKYTFKEAANKATTYLSKYEDWCLIISTASDLIKLFQAVVKATNDQNIANKLIALSQKMLSKSWRDVFGNAEKGLHFNQNVDTLLNAYFSKPDLSALKTFTVEVSEQCSGLLNKNSCLDSMRCINKANFPLLFRAVMKALYESTKTKIDRGLTDRQHLTLWMDVAVVMKVLKDILQTLNGRSNLSAYLKNSIPLLKLFLSQGMPMMDLKLKSDPDSVVDILRTLQHSTRFLHSLYCHSRLQKDTSLIAYLPQMKLVLETLVYKVKASLTINKCREAFWMGNLKNKNLQGELISSQSTTVSENDDEDQLPEDENPIDESEEGSDDDMKSISSAF